MPALSVKLGVLNSTKKGNAMKRTTTTLGAGATAIVQEAYQEVEASFERFCLSAGLATLTEILEADASALCGARHGRSPERSGHRWGRAKGKIGFHGGRVEVERPRVRLRGGGEVALPSWEAAQRGGLAGPVGDEPDADQRVDA